jgi:hypothetical protein
MLSNYEYQTEDQYSYLFSDFYANYEGEEDEDELDKEIRAMNEFFAELKEKFGDLVESIEEGHCPF